MNGLVSSGNKPLLTQTYVAIDQSELNCQFDSFRCSQWLSGSQCEHLSIPETTITSQWLYNKRDGVSNHRCGQCLLNRLLRRKSKKISKPRVTGLCDGNSPMTSTWIPLTKGQKCGNCFHLMTSPWLISLVTTVAQSTDEYFGPLAMENALIS